MKNLLITAQYEVTNMYGTTKPEDYKELTDRCLKSFTKNLKDIDDTITLIGEVNTYHELFQQIYKHIRQIYKDQRPCNILWVDSDNICLRPVEIFGKFKDFAMFYSVEQYRTSFVMEECLKLTKNLSPWMMANIRYYPNNMKQFIWEIGDDLAYSWIEDWAYETIIYNAMFHGQKIDANEYIKPEWNVQGEGSLESITKELIKDAVILHCHSTRNSGLAIQKMDKALNLIKED
jgi:hypothetical protein